MMPAMIFLGKGVACGEAQKSSGKSWQGRRTWGTSKRNTCDGHGGHQHVARCLPKACGRQRVKLLFLRMSGQYGEIMSVEELESVVSQLPANDLARFSQW